jgi:hypothetical protein
MYAKIYSNCYAFSCCAKSSVKLGSLIDGTFSLLEEPILCKEKDCLCWKRMVIEKEEFWGRALGCSRRCKIVIKK